MSVVEVRSTGASVALNGHRLAVRVPERPPAYFHADELDLLIAEGPAVHFTGAALGKLAESGITVLLCDGRHLPVGFVVPAATGGVFDPRRARRQASLPERTRDRLWKSIIQCKILRQAEHLKRAGLAFDRLLQLAREVQPGDPENREATAARIYWQRLYGRDFRRRGDDPRVSALNWGYAVLRAMVSRSLVASGLHPAIGLKHMAPNNPFNLADDLMEPFRPLVDAAVRTIEPEAGDPSLWKSALSEIGERPVLLPEGVFRLRSAITRMASSFAQVIDAGKGKILLPQAFPGEEDAGRLESDVVDGPL